MAVPPATRLEAAASPAQSDGARQHGDRAEQRVASRARRARRRGRSARFARQRQRLKFWEKFRNLIFKIPKNFEDFKKLGIKYSDYY